MYKLVHTHTKLKISFSTIFSTCVKNTELIYIYIYIYIKAWLKNSRFSINIHFIKINLQESLQMSNKCASAKTKNSMHTWLLYNWHHNMYLSQNCHALNYATHTFQVSS